MKTLYTLCVTYNGTSAPLHFETYDCLLAARGALYEANIPGLTMDEDPATRLLFVTPGKAADHVHLWVASLGGAHAPVPAVKTAPAASADAEETLPSGLTHKEETLHMLLRPAGVTLEQMMERFKFERRDSASALISTTCSKFGYTATRSDTGVYTAAKGREDGKGEPKAAPKADKPKAAPEVHVLGRGRKVAERRAHH